MICILSFLLRFAPSNFQKEAAHFVYMIWTAVRNWHLPVASAGAAFNGLIFMPFCPWGVVWHRFSGSSV